MRGRASERSRFFDSLTDCGPGFCRGRSACRKTGKLHRREGRVCAGNPGRVSCTIAIKSFQNVFKVLKTCAVCQKRVFDRLCGPGFCRGRSACRKTGKLHRREGRVCAGNPGRVSCTIAIKSFQNVFKVLKTCAVCQKRVFDRLCGPGFCRGRFHFIIPALHRKTAGFSRGPRRHPRILAWL